MLENTSEKQPAEINNNGIQISHHEVEPTYIGPIPPPEILNSYDKIQPGFAERIIVMAEKEQSERHKCNELIIGQVHRESMYSIVAGSLLSFTLMVIGAIVILNADNNIGVIIAGSVFGLSGVGTIITSLIKRNSYDDETKNQNENKNNK